jgi:hypothetical protein
MRHRAASSPRKKNHDFTVIGALDVKDFAYSPDF